MNGALIKLYCMAYILLTSYVVSGTKEKTNDLYNALALATGVVIAFIVIKTWNEEDVVDIRWGVPTLLYTSALWVRWWYFA